MIGSRIGNWVIDKELGEGGMGKVYLAHEILPSTPETTADVPPRRAAIKFLAAELAREPDFVTRFEREIASLRTLKHPNIVEFYESGRHEGALYYVMEYVDGPSVEQIMLQRGRLSWQEVVEIALQVCPALKLAHDHGIIHRDLKPPNLLVRGDGVVKLTDFGVAKIFATQRLTATRAVVGTAEFMSPEQAAGKPITNRSDLYSLGVLMYVLLVGRPLFKADSLVEMLHKHRYARFDPPRAVVSEIPPELDRIVCQLLEKEPDQRPRDALVLSRQLEVLRRKQALKEADPLLGPDSSAGETLAAEGTGKTRGGAQPPGPATIMSHLMREELHRMQRPGPVARFFNQPVVIVALLACVIALLVWGLWPASAERLLEKAQTQAADGAWDQAAETLDRLEQKHSGHSLGEPVAELRARIEEGRVLQKARAAYGAVGFEAPKSDGERFYLEAVQDYRAGRIERAKEKWQNLIDAFDRVSSEQHWALLARDALKQAGAGEEVAQLAAANEAIEQALKETGADRTRRLQALLKLYADRQDEAAKAVRGRIEKLLGLKD